MTWKINMNSDMGEGYGHWRLGPDEELIPLVRTVNIACGFHAGDPNVLEVTRRVREWFADCTAAADA